MKNKRAFCPDRILSYFRAEWLSLIFITLSGSFYNVGLLATPWFEGRLAQCLADILGGNKTAGAMAIRHRKDINDISVLSKQPPPISTII